MKKYVLEIVSHLIIGLINLNKEKYIMTDIQVFMGGGVVRLEPVGDGGKTRLLQNINHMLTQMISKSTSNSITNLHNFFLFITF